MIKVNFFYPNTDGSKFDMDYYLNVHRPLVIERFGEALKEITIERGISGVEPGSKPPFHATGSLTFDSIEAFYGAILPIMDELRADAAKYSEGDPIIQISETPSVE